MILGKVSITLKGAYNPSIPYTNLDMVSSGGGSYVSKLNNNLFPLTDVNAWQKVAEKGEKGDAGANVLGVTDKATTTTVPTPWTSGSPNLFEIYAVYDAGTYTNFKNASNVSLVVTSGDLANNVVQLWVKNGVAEKVLNPKLLPTQFIPAFSTSTFPLTATVSDPIQRVYNNTIYDLVAGQTSTSSDVPGTSSKWVKLNDIKTSSVPAGKNLFNKNAVIPNQYIVAATGVITPVVGNFKTTEIIRINPSSQLAISGLPSVHNALGYIWYGADKTTKVGNAFTASDVTTATVTAPSNAYYFQLTVNSGKSGEVYNGDTIQIEVGSAATSYEAYIPLITQINDSGITVEKVNTDALQSQSPVSVSYFNSNAVRKTGLTLETGGKNLFNKNAVIPNQYIVAATGVIQSAVGNFKTTEIIKITPSSSIAVSGLPSIHNAYGYIWYGADKTTKVGNAFTAADVTTAILTAPSNAFYLQLTVNSGKSGEVYNGDTIQIEIGVAPTSYEAFTQVVTAIENYGIKSNSSSAITLKTEGKNAFLFGDSITATAGESGTPITNWPSYAFPLMKATYTNFALSGAHIEDFTTSSPRQKFSVQIDQAIATGIQPDFIVVAIGINSLNVADNDYITTMGKSLESLDITKVMDAMRINLRRIAEAFPSAVLYYGTPMQAIKSGASDEQLTQRKVIDQFKLMARTFNFKIIDAFEEVGVVRDFEVKDAAGRYLTDGLHPNAAGKEKQGKFYANRIIAQYP